MPIIRSAKKKVKQDKKKTVGNKKFESTYKRVIRTFNQAGKNTKKSLSELHSSIDKAAKKGVIHKKKANRLKSRLSKKTQSNKK